MPNNNVIGIIIIGSIAIHINALFNYIDENSFSIAKCELNETKSGESATPSAYPILIAIEFITPNSYVYIYGVEEKFNDCNVTKEPIKQPKAIKSIAAYNVKFPPKNSYITLIQMQIK